MKHSKRPRKRISKKIVKLSQRLQMPLEKVKKIYYRQGGDVRSTIFIARLNVA